MITLSDKGAEKVHEFLASQQADVAVAGLRVGVRGGGCSGFQYQLAFDEQRGGDVVFESHGLKLLIDIPWQKHLCFLDSEVSQRLTPDELDALFDLGYHFKHVDTIFDRVFGKTA